MAEAHLEYIGFVTQGEQREYTVRLRQPGGANQDFVLAVPLEAFLSRRARFQDAPDICFRIMQRALADSPESLPPLFRNVSDDDLDAYRQATAPHTTTRRPKPPAPVEPQAADGTPPPRRGWL